MKMLGKNYRLLGKVAQGGMAEIYKAEKIGLDGCNKVVAIKRILKKENADLSEFKKMFAQEAKVIQHLDHPNIVQFYDYFEEDEEPYIAFQYVEGLNLAELLKLHRENKQLIPLNVYLHILCEVLNGLDYAHKKKHNNEPLNIIHRDVSPQNILVSKDGIVKLADFGIAKASIEREIVTKKYEIKGKINYFSPEQVKYETLTYKIDLYSLGMMLFEYIYGYNPYSNKDDQIALKNISINNKHEQQESLFEISGELKALIKKAIANSPEDRFEDAQQFRSELIKQMHPKWQTEGDYLLKDYLAQIDFKKKLETIQTSYKQFNEDLDKETRLLTQVFTTIKTQQIFKRSVTVIVLLCIGTLFFLKKKLDVKEVIIADKISKPRVKIIEKQEQKTIEIESKKVLEKIVKKVTAKKKRPEVNFGHVNIEGPEGAIIFINGQRRGETSLKTKLKKGSYSIVISPQFGQPYVTRVNVTKNKESSVRWEG